MFTKLTHYLPVALLAAGTLGTPCGAEAADPPNIYDWRGLSQNGTFGEHYEGYSFDPEPAWIYDAHGRGTPVVVDGRLFSFGYKGAREDLVELLTAHDPATGEVIWQDELRDFISDTVYNRYAVGAPTVDPETKNVYLMTANGLFRAYTFDGEVLWEISLMERFGRLTFPNGRVGSPTIEGDLVIVRGIVAYWGGNGPARDRFLAFDKRTGENVWISTPGVEPQDSSFSTPVLETRDGIRVFYAGTGCGNIVAVNARNGNPLWRFQMGQGGVNSTPLIYKDTIICIHGVQNIDTSNEGRMIAVKIPDDLAASDGAALEPSAEVWRNGLTMFTSSPTLVGDRVYQLTNVGTLACVNADSGEILWEEKFGTDNIHSSPLYADGLLYVPMNSGTLYVVKPSDSGPETLHEVKLEGNCLGQPMLWNGHLFVHTTSKLYCFKIKHEGITFDPAPEAEIPAPGEVAELQIVPNDVLLKQGETQDFTIRKTDANGFVVGEGEVAEAEWAEFIPPTARVKATLDATFNEDGQLVVAQDASMSAGAFQATLDGVSGIIRGRTLPALPYEESFEGVELDETTSGGVAFAYPPLPWIGARFKFDIRELEGNKVFAKNLDRILFQRGVAFIGDPNLSNYTLQSDIMVEGDRRKKMDAGVVNQRYAIVLKGNYNQLEISSNFERLTASVPFPIKAGTWYTLKTRVDSGADGAGVVRAKAWEREAPEPEEWTIELEVPAVHQVGAPGLFGFALQNLKKTYHDNIKITSNAEAP
ncbi:PQQ-like beta-propeller repeat protein [soil metagenome]